MNPLYLLAYFRQIYLGRVEIDAHGVESVVQTNDAPFESEYLHLAVSRDGRHFDALNENRPVWNCWLRDPFINRGADGQFHLLATGAQGPRSCLYATSPDLISWQARPLPLMESVPHANNIWAPEWFYDDRSGEYLLFWSSSFEDTGWKSSRLWSCRTRDWRSFSRAQLMFDPPYSVIDGTLVERGGTYFLFHKEEEFGALMTERRAIRVATSRSLDGPWTIHDGPLNGGQIVPTITEGPALMPDPMGEGWLLLYDFCMGNDYGVSRSANLLDWQIEADVSFPPGARHGSVTAIAEAELERLQQAWPAAVGAQMP